jgi:hypothetical protein
MLLLSHLSRASLLTSHLPRGDSVCWIHLLAGFYHNNAVLPVYFISIMYTKHKSEELMKSASVWTSEILFR